MRTLQTQIGWCARTQWVLMLTLLGCAGAFYLLGYRPASQRLTQLDAQIAGQQRELETNEMRTQIRPLVERKVNDLRAKLNRFDKKLPKQQELDQFLRELTHLSDQSGLRGLESKYAVPQHKRLVMELPVELEFKGDFLATFAFLRQMEQMERLTRVRALTMTAVPNAPGQVGVKLSLAIYFSEG